MLSIKKNLVYNFLLSASMVLFPLISIPYISRVLDPSGIGKVSFIDSFTYYFIGIAEFGIAVYGMREVARQKDNKENLRLLVSELMTLHLISSGVAFVFYFISVVFIWNKIEDTRLLLFSISFLLVNSFACEWYFWGMEKFKYITFRSLLTRTLGLISMFLLIHGAEDYYLYYAIIALSAITSYIWNLIIVIREVPLKLEGLNWRKHVTHLWTNYLISIIFGITLSLDNVLLRLTSSAASVGFYAFSMKIVRLSSLLLTDSLLVFFPRAVTALKNNRYTEFQHLILRNVQLIIIISIPVCAGIFLLAQEITSVILGAAFKPSARNLEILAIFPFLKAYNLYLGNQVLVSTNRERIYLRNLSIASLIYLPVIFVLSGYFNDAGASLAMVIYEFLLVFLNYYYIRKHDRQLIIFDSRSFLQTVFAAFFFIPVISFIKDATASDFYRLLCSISACAIIYFFLLGVLLKNEFVLNLKNIGWRLFKKYSRQI